MLYLVTKFEKPGRSSSSSALSLYLLFTFCFVFLFFFFFLCLGGGGGGVEVGDVYYMVCAMHFLSSEVPTAFNFRFFSCSMSLVIAISLGSSPAIHQMAYGT